jgi:hypothetical protein
MVPSKSLACNHVKKKRRRRKEKEEEEEVEKILHDGNFEMNRIQT